MHEVNLNFFVFLESRAVLLQHMESFFNFFFFSYFLNTARTAEQTELVATLSFGHTTHNTQVCQNDVCIKIMVSNMFPLLHIIQTPKNVSLVPVLNDLFEMLAKYSVDKCRSAKYLSYYLR